MKFDNFSHIQHRPLRIYNRAVMFHNIYEDQGKYEAEDYANSFSQAERLEMAQMTALVRTKGPKAVKALVTAGVQFMDENVEAVV